MKKSSKFVLNTVRKLYLYIYNCIIVFAYISLYKRQRKLRDSVPKREFFCPTSGSSYSQVTSITLFVIIFVKPSLSYTVICFDCT